MKIYSGGPLDFPAQTAAQIWHEVALKNADQVGYRARPANGGPYRAYTWKETKKMIDEVGNGLLSLGIEAGEKVALVSETRMEWSIADYAILSSGGVTVTVYPTLTDDQVAYLLKDSGSTTVFVEDQKQLDKVTKALPDNPQIKRIVAFTPVTASGAAEKLVTPLAVFREEGQAFATANPGALDARIAAGKPTDIATLVYTSGTTGMPKGAILTHANFVSAGMAARKQLELKHGASTVCFLPLAHCYGRLQLQLAVGVEGSVAFGSPATLVEDFKEIRPTMIASVPRLYERMYDQIVKKVDAGPDGKKKIFHAAAATAREYGQAISNGGTAPLGLRLKHMVFDRLVYAKLRDALGLTQLAVSITGAAAIRPDLLTFFQGIGVPILEGYGLTETSAPSNVNLPRKFKPGAVGPPFPGMEMKLDEDGEVLMKGPNVFQGYYNLDKETAEAFTSDGWFRTGDIGTFDDDGFLKIVDRKKELEILSTGKNVAPVLVEETLKVSDFVSEALAVGHGQKYVGILIQPNFDALVDWADKAGVAYDKSQVVVKPDPTGQPMTYQVGRDLLADSKVKALYQEAITTANTKLANFEQIKTFAFADHAFTMDRDELTPTLKKKRRIIRANYEEQIATLFPSS